MGKSTRFAIEVSSPKRDNVTQSERFEQAARELGCDSSEEKFDQALRTIAKQKPHPHQPQKRSKDSE